MHKKRSSKPGGFYQQGGAEPSPAKKAKSDGDKKGDKKGGKAIIIEHW
jgi:hypothetical protein